MRTLLKAGLILGSIALLIVGCDNNSLAPEPDLNQQTDPLALAGIPSDATVDSAWIAIHVSHFDTQTVTVHRVLNPWTESGLTFNNFPTWNGDDTVAVLNIQDTGWVMFPITDLVAEWVMGNYDNYGLAFRRSDTGAGFAQYDSREVPGFEPYLRICYTDNTDPQCEMFTATADAYIDETMPEANYGASPDLYTGRDTSPTSYRWTFIAFEFPIETAGGVIGDYVWLDENMNGIQDAGEPGIPDLTVELYTCSDDMFVASTMTQESGFYWFVDLEPDSYYISITPPDGYEFTLMDQGDNNAFDSDIDPMTGKSECVTLDFAGEEYHKLDAGLVDTMIVDGGCTRSKGYWKNHAGFGPQEDVVTPLLPIYLGDEGGEATLLVDNAQIAYDILTQHVYGHPSNGITKLYAQLLAAKLNIAAGADPSAVADVIGDADAFLADYDWTDWNMLSKEQKMMVLEWKDLLDWYNNGIIGPGKCDENGDDNGYHDGDDDCDDDNGYHHDDDDDDDDDDDHDDDYDDDDDDDCDDDDDGGDDD